MQTDRQGQRQQQTLCSVGPFIVLFIPHARTARRKSAIVCARANKAAAAATRFREGLAGSLNCKKEKSL